MTIHVDVHFHGLERSEAVEARVHAKAAKLARHCPRMTHCRVAIEAPHRHAHKTRAFQVKLEISVPHQDAIVVSPPGEYVAAHEDIQVALKDAFATALRRIDQTVDLRQARAKRERGRRRPGPSRAPSHADDAA